MNYDTSSRNGLDISVTGEPSAAELDAVRLGLVAFTTSMIGPAEAMPLAVVVRRDGQVVAGAAGFTQWEWLFVEYLWVADDVRGEGLGTHILGKAEAAARDRGCVAVWLDTFSFQAPRFYKRLGFRQFGQLDDFPPGHARHFLWKPLAYAPDPQVVSPADQHRAGE